MAIMTGPERLHAIDARAGLLTHGLPGVALGCEPVDPGVMSRPPRPSAESALGAGLWQRILRVRLVMAAFTLVSPPGAASRPPVSHGPGPAEPQEVRRLEVPVYPAEGVRRAHRLVDRGHQLA
jgi:Cation transporting ATPase, C-terminus